MDVAVEGIVTELENGLSGCEGEVRRLPADARTRRPHGVFHVQRQAVDAGPAVLVDDQDGAPVDTHLQPRLPGHSARARFLCVGVTEARAAFAFGAEFGRSGELAQ